MPSPSKVQVELLILGAGWSSTFLASLCVARNITYAATFRTPPPPDSPPADSPKIPFTFDPSSDDPVPYTILPFARTVLITFPITVSGSSERLVRLYLETHQSDETNGEVNFIQLGSTGIWGTSADLQSHQPLSAPSTASTLHTAVWFDRHSPFTPNPRAAAEAELLKLNKTSFPTLQDPTRTTTACTTVLNLAGLWGGARDARAWVARVAPTKDALRKKGSIHLLHGADLAQAILAVHARFDAAAGQRWLLTDGRVYDWWDLAGAWGAGEGEVGNDSPAQWVQELVTETQGTVRVLPRDSALLGRVLDAREFWETFHIIPVKARV